MGICAPWRRLERLDMKRLGLLAAGLLLLPLVGCGGGGTVRSIVGTWRWSAIGGAGLSTGTALSTCPGAVTINGVEVTCGPTDITQFNSSGEFVNNTVDDLGRKARERGTYTVSGGDFTVTVVETAIDYDSNGVYTGDEIEEEVEPITYTGRVERSEGSDLVITFGTESLQVGVLLTPA